MLSFRVEADLAEQVEAWAEALGVARSEVLREALRRHLVTLRAEHDVDAWTETPLTEAEAALGDIADWGPAEDWTDWSDATGADAAG